MKKANNVLYSLTRNDDFSDLPILCDERQTYFPILPAVNLSF